MKNENGMNDQTPPIPYKPLAITLSPIRVGKAPLIDESTERLSTSQAVYELTREYSEADREIMLVVMMNCKNELIRLETHSIGTIDASMVYPREVFRSLLIHNATSFIIVHNHPSGDTEPSYADKELTKVLGEGANILEIRLLDHIILGSGRYFSFADQGLLI